MVIKHFCLRSHTIYFSYLCQKRKPFATLAYMNERLITTLINS